MTSQEFDDAICDLLMRYGLDRHIDGHEQITKYVENQVAGERQACAKIALRDVCANPACAHTECHLGRQCAAAICARGAK